MGGNSVSKVADEQSFATVVPEGMTDEASNHMATAEMPQKVGAVENGTHEERSALSHGNDDDKASLDDRSETKAQLSASDIVDGIDDEYKEGAKGLLVSAMKRGAKNLVKVSASTLAEMVPGGKQVLTLCAEIYGRGMKLKELDEELKMAKELILSLAEEVVLAIESMGEKKDFLAGNLVDALKACRTAVCKANTAQEQKLAVIMTDALKNELLDAQEQLKQACNAMSFAWAAKLQRTLAEHGEALQSLKTDVAAVSDVKGDISDIKAAVIGNASLSDILKPVIFDDIEDQASRVVAGTRRWAFDDFRAFMDSPTDTLRVLAAGAGVGKTGIMSKLVCDFPEDVAAYFFCQHSDSRMRDPKKMLCTLAYQLSCCENLNEYKSALQGLKLWRHRQYESHCTVQRNS